MKVKIFLFVPLLLIVAIIIYLALPWFLINIGIQLQPNPPRPEITYGEFPFRLEYEINGERKIVKDTIICEFDGFGSDEGRGKYRKWKEKLASGNERITLLKVNDTKEIFFSPGTPEYYMDDLESRKSGSSFPDAIFIEKDGRITTSGLITADELLKEYNIKLISWDAKQPIKNNFSQTKK
jgi:hypothetical protein